MKMDENKIVNWFKLTNVRGIGPSKIMKLISIFGSVDKIFNSDNETLIRTRVFNDKQLSEWEKLKNASDENFLKVIGDCRENGIEIIRMVDEKYPKRLLAIPYPPYTLFVKGETSLLESDGIAIVGTRRPEENALEWTAEIAEKIAESGNVIISGGAIGIDRAAHLGSLKAKNGKTIAVLGSGLLRPFPEENMDIFNQISEKGLLISEHLPRFPGSRFALIQRNRITSGLSKVLILSASKAGGGGMVQSKIAHDQKIPILVPSDELGLNPKEGIHIAREEYGATDVKTYEDVLRFVGKITDKINIQRQESVSKFV